MRSRERRACLDKVVVFSKFGPWPARDFVKFDEFPVGDVGGAELEIVADGGRYIQAGSSIEVGGWAFTAENVLPVIGTEGAAVAPLSVADFSGAVPYGNPSITADALAFFYKRLFEPMNDGAGFRFNIHLWRHRCKEERCRKGLILGIKPVGK